jgi:hypothetical protein
MLCYYVLRSSAYTPPAVAAAPYMPVTCGSTGLVVKSCYAVTSVSAGSEEIGWNTNCKEEEARFQSLKKEGEGNKYFGGTAEVNKKEVEVIDLSMED